MSPIPRVLLSPNEAAQLAGCGRSSVMRAIRSGSLPATRGNHNAWTLRREDVERWAGQRPVTEPVPERPVTEQVIGQGPDITGLAIEVAVLRTKLEAAEARAAELAADRDRWHALAMAPRPSLIDRIISRIRTPATIPAGV